MNYFTIIFRLLWLLLLFLLIFFDRDNPYILYFTLFLVFFLGITTSIRALESRNEWREIIQDSDLEDLK